jgi:DNA adenine methylase
MKTPLSYYGGKAKIAGRIMPIIWSIPHTVYAEPFAGGLSVLYAKGIPPITDKCHYREAINDRNKNLITFWRVAREQPEELARWLDLTPYSQEEYRRTQKIYKAPCGYSDLEIAWATYIQCNMSFANRPTDGWATQTIGANSAATWINRNSRLPECFERLKSVHAACEDALAFIKRWDSSQTLFYCDPPYPGTNQGHYKGYTLADFQALCDALDNCKGSYILSNYNQPITPQSAQRCIDIEAMMSAANGKDREIVDCKRTEKLWICDRSSGMRPDLAEIAAAKPSNQLSIL